MSRTKIYVNIDELIESEDHRDNLWAACKLAFSLAKEYEFKDTPLESKPHLANNAMYVRFKPSRQGSIQKMKVDSREFIKFKNMAVAAADSINEKEYDSSVKEFINEIMSYGNRGKSTTLDYKKASKITFK